MVVRLVPHRSLRYRYAEATATLLAYAVPGLTGRELEATWWGAEPRAYILPLIFGWLGTIVLLMASNYWSRARGAEMVPFPEAARRAFADRAAVPMLEYALRYSLYMGTYGTIAFLLLFRIEDWKFVPFFAVGWFVVGFIFGLYTSHTSRVNARASEQASSAPPPPRYERIYRHYLGYVVGLTLALVVTTVMERGHAAFVAVFAVFVVGKMATDFLRPQLPVRIAAEMRTRWWTPLYMLVFGALWWGVPFAVLMAIMLFSLDASPPPEVLLQVLMVPLAMGASIALMMWLFVAAVRLGPRAPEAALDPVKGA